MCLQAEKSVKNVNSDNFPTMASDYMDSSRLIYSDFKSNILILTLHNRTATMKWETFRLLHKFSKFYYFSGFRGSIQRGFQM